MEKKEGGGKVRGVETGKAAEKGGSTRRNRSGWGGGKKLG